MEKETSRGDTSKQNCFHKHESSLEDNDTTYEIRMNTTTTTSNRTSVNNNSDDVPSSKDNEDEDNKVCDSGVSGGKDDKETVIIKPEPNGQGIEEDDESNSSFKVQMRKSRSYSKDNNSYQHETNENSSFSSSRKNSSFLSRTIADYSDAGGEDTVRITGYLEKRSKMLGWKKFWFVLDGRLLAYYKSKSDYDSLSACCGSINLGIASTVRPIQIRGCKGYPIQIVTRSQVYYLRSTDKQILEHWLIAIQEAASSQPKISYPVWTDPGTQFFRYSFAALSQWSLNNSSDDITESLSQLPQNFYLKGGGPHRTQSKLHKCHSFASLQTPALYTTMPLKHTKAKINSNKAVESSDKKFQVSTTNTEEGKIRHSTSMLLLESSDQAAALKEELTKKLSIGTTEGQNTVKPSLTNLKSKSDFPFLKSPNNVDNQDDDECHHYDEIVDFEAIYENYEHCGDGSSSEGANRTRNNSSDCEQVDTDIYESVETMEGDLLNDSIPKKGLIKNENPNSSLQKSDSLRNLPALPESNQLPPYHKKYSIESDTSSVNSYGDMSLQSEKSNKKWKNKPFGGFFHKMFHREKGKKSKGAPPLVITGPVDLRSLHHKSQNSPINRPTNLPITEIEAGLATLRKSPPVIGSKPAFDNERVMDELKMKVKRLSRTGLSNSETENSANVLRKFSVEKELNSSSNTAKNTKTFPDIKTEEKNWKILDINKIDDYQKQMTNDIASPSEERDELLVDPVVKRRRGSQSEEFQQKLAKFNRLSERLSSSFVLALNPIPVTYPTIGPIGRSNSWKISKTFSHDDSSPPLPPKKKHNPNLNSKPNFYDYPTNNRPISKDKTNESQTTNLESSSQDLDETKNTPADTSIATFIRSLNKKNSAPDVIFSNSREHIGEDNVFDEILCLPPPIPPKNFGLESSFKPFYNRSEIKALDEEKGSQLSYTTKNDRDCKREPELSSHSYLKIENNENVKLSPSTSHKSTDFDNLEVLSDLSDTNASNTPPGTPIKSEDQKYTSSAASQLLLNGSSSNNDLQQDSLNIMDSMTSDGNNHFAVDSLSNTPIECREMIQGLTAKKIDKNNSCTSEMDNIYENMRFATVNTLIQEFETVEEAEDEISEMYDDFPTEFLTSVNLTNYLDQDTTTTSPSSISSNSSDLYSSPSLSEDRSPSYQNQRDTIRHSGIDQLQEFLSLESNVSITSSDFPSIEVEDLAANFTPLPTFNKTPVRAGAISRLGHSSAVDKLQRIVGNSIRTARSDL